jgi:hypothetical protein
LASEVRNVQAEQHALEQEVATGHKVGLKKNSKENVKTTGATLEILWWQLNRCMNTEGMSCRHQVIISRLRMGYTSLTHRYRINGVIRPLCTDCKQTSRLNTYYGNARTTTSTEVGATYSEREALGNNKEEAKMVIKYLKEIGLLQCI